MTSSIVNFILEGFSIEDISFMTKKSVEEIEQVKKEYFAEIRRLEVYERKVADEKVARDKKFAKVEKVLNSVESLLAEMESDELLSMMSLNVYKRMEILTRKALVLTNEYDHKRMESRLNGKS